jgi:hypothetical protein
MFLYELGDRQLWTLDTGRPMSLPSVAIRLLLRIARQTPRPAKVQKFQRRRQNDAGEIDDLKRSVSYPKSSAPATKHAMA